MDQTAVPFVLFFLVAPVMLAFALWYQRKRAKAAQAWAASVGWTYVGTDRSLLGRWRGQPFDTGSSRRVFELVTGRYRGRPAMSFGYQYTTGSGKNRTTHTHHVVAIALPAYLPTLELTPDGLGAKIFKALGGQDIQFESEEFNRAWRVAAGDDKFAHDVLHPRLMERLLRQDARGSSIRVEGTDLLSWSMGMPAYQRVAGRLDLLCAVADAVPRFVWLDHGHDPAQATAQPGLDGPRAV